MQINQQFVVNANKTGHIATKGNPDKCLSPCPDTRYTSAVASVGAAHGVGVGGVSEIEARAARVRLLQQSHAAVKR
jgi:hypothetical protein